MEKKQKEHSVIFFGIFLLLHFVTDSYSEGQYDTRVLLIYNEYTFRDLSAFSIIEESYIEAQASLLPYISLYDDMIIVSDREDDEILKTYIEHEEVALVLGDISTILRIMGDFHSIESMDKIFFDPIPVYSPDFNPEFPRNFFALGRDIRSEINEISIQMNEDIWKDDFAIITEYIDPDFEKSISYYFENDPIIIQSADGSKEGVMQSIYSEIHAHNTPKYLFNMLNDKRKFQEIMKEYIKQSYHPVGMSFILDELQYYADCISLWAKAAHETNISQSGVNNDLIADKLRAQFNNESIGYRPDAKGSGEICGSDCPEKCKNNCYDKDELKCCSTTG